MIAGACQVRDDRQHQVVLHLDVLIVDLVHSYTNVPAWYKLRIPMYQLATSFPICVGGTFSTGVRNQQYTSCNLCGVGQQRLGSCTTTSNNIWCSWCPDGTHL